MFNKMLANALVYTVLPILMLFEVSLAETSCQTIFRDKFTVEFLESIISVPPGSQFYGPSGEYGRVMSKALLNLDPQIGGFDFALRYLVEKRIEVIKSDLENAKTTEDIEFFKGQLKYMSSAPTSTMNKRMQGNGWPTDRIQTPVRAENENFQRYKDFYQILKATGIGFRSGSMEFERWSPPMPPNSPQLHAPPLEIVFDGIYWVKHAQNQDIPAILNHLSKLWDMTLKSRDIPTTQRLIAEFEWWFFAGNPTARGAASLGDLLSLSLQINKGLKLRNDFLHMDWFALTCSLDDYVSWRLSMETKTGKRD